MELPSGESVAPKTDSSVMAVAASACWLVFLPEAVSVLAASLVPAFPSSEVFWAEVPVWLAVEGFLNIKLYTKMKQNSEENFQPIQTDPITGEYYIVIPEWIANELSWYEDTEISFTLEGTEVVLTENK